LLVEFVPRNQEKVMRPLLAGLVGGIAATTTMTIAAEAMFRCLPRNDQRRPLPPRQVTMNLADSLGVDRFLQGENDRFTLSMLTHYDYGTAMGIVYALAARRILPGALGGAAFGLGLYAFSYLGLLPALGLHGGAQRMSPERNALLIAGHLVYGVTLGIMTQSLLRQRRRARNDEVPMTNVERMTNFQ
jgi:uncharacterized membrane protein YagU involved in acid resistance